MATAKYVRAPQASWGKPVTVQVQGRGTHRPRSGGAAPQALLPPLQAYGSNELDGESTEKAQSPPLFVLGAETSMGDWCWWDGGFKHDFWQSYGGWAWVYAMFQASRDSTGVFSMLVSMVVAYFFGYNSSLSIQKGTCTTRLGNFIFVTLTALGVAACPATARPSVIAALAMHQNRTKFTRKCGGVWRSLWPGATLVLLADAAFAAAGYRPPLYFAVAILSHLALTDIRHEREAPPQKSGITLFDSSSGQDPSLPTPTYPPASTLVSTHSATTVSTIVAALHVALFASLLRMPRIPHSMFPAIPLVTVGTCTYLAALDLLRSLPKDDTEEPHTVTQEQATARRNRAQMELLVPAGILWTAARGSVVAGRLVPDLFGNPAFLFSFIASAFYTAQYNTMLGDRASRKALHIGIGALLLILQPSRFTVGILGVIVMATQVVSGKLGIKPRFARNAFDLGMFEYALLVTICAVSNLPWVALAPAFFADPIAMLVGSRIKSPVWTGNKTIAGSSAAFIATAVCVGGTIPGRLGAATLVTAAEAFGGKHDNICVGLVCLMVAAWRKTQLA